MVWIWVVAGLTWVIVMMGIAQLSRFYSKFQEGRRELDANLLNMAGQFKKMQSTLTELLAEQRRRTPPACVPFKTPNRRSSPIRSMRYSTIFHRSR